MDLTPELRSEVVRLADEMHHLFASRHTPYPKKSKACASCSLKDACLPGLKGRETVREYFERRLGEVQ